MRRTVWNTSPTYAALFHGFVAMLSTIPAWGEKGVETARKWDAISLFVGQGVDHNLRELPTRIVTGNPRWEKSYMNALTVKGGDLVLGQRWATFDGTAFAEVRQGYELVLAKHHGVQSNAEIGGAYTLKTPILWLSALGLSFASGIGLSYALGTPTYEDGAAGDPQKRYRLQLLLLFDLEWRMEKLKNWALVTRIHHRSGAYGLIAPRHVGSNFLVAGVQYSFL